MDTLRYSDTCLTICLAGMERREINNVIRQVYVYRDRIQICPCVQPNPWVRKTLQNLNVKFKNEPSHPTPGTSTS